MEGKEKTDYYTPPKKLPSDPEQLRADYLSELEIPHIQNRGQSPSSEPSATLTDSTSDRDRLEQPPSQPPATSQLANPPHRSLIEKIIDKFTGKAA